MKKKVSGSEVAGAVLLVLAGVPAIVLGATLVVGFFNALAIVHLWEWFAVPALGVKPLTMPVAFGLSLIVDVLVPHGDDHAKKEDNASWSLLLASIFRSLFALGIGWIVQAVWL